MAFQLKDFNSIVASMVNYIRGATNQLTDFNVGSGTRTLIEAPAIEMDQLYQEAYSAVREGIETSVFRSFDLELFEAETFAERQARFSRFVQSLARATVTGIAAGAETATLTDGAGEVTERVRHAETYEPYVDDTNEPVGFTQCFIHNGTSSASPELVERAQQIIDGYVESGVAVPGWKGSGLPVDVIAATDVPIDAEYQITVASGVPSEKAAEAQQAIEDFISGLAIGKDFDPDCGASAVKVVGVGCVKAVLPAAPVVVGVGGKAVPGTITVTTA